MPLGKKLKKLFVADGEEGLPKKDLPVVSIEEEETIKELLKPPKKKIVKTMIVDYEEVRKIIPHVQAGDLVIIDLRKMLSKPNDLQKVAHKIEGIATASESVVVRISGCEAHLMIIPSDMEIHKLD